MTHENTAPEATLDSPTLTDAARRLRSLVPEAESRGAPMVSAEAMQARLFEIYDEASTSPEALELVHQHLRLTLDRTWYSAEEVAAVADQLDWLLAVDGTRAPDVTDVEPGEPVPEA